MLALTNTVFTIVEIKLNDPTRSHIIVLLMINHVEYGSPGVLQRPPLDYGTVKQTFCIVGGVYLYHLHFQSLTEGHHHVWSLWLNFTLPSISQWATSAHASSLTASFLFVPKYCLCFFIDSPYNCGKNCISLLQHHGVTE